MGPREDDGALFVKDFTLSRSQLESPVIFGINYVGPNVGLLVRLGNADARPGTVI